MPSKRGTKRKVDGAASAVIPSSDKVEVSEDIQILQAKL